MDKTGNRENTKNLIKEEINNMQILASTQNEDMKKVISIVVSNEDIQNNRPRFYAFRAGILYSPVNEFRPIEGNGKSKLPADVVQEYQDILPLAMREFDKIKDIFKSGQNGGNSSEMEKENDSLRRMVQARQERIERLQEKIEEIKNTVQPKPNPEQSMLEKLKNITDQLETNLPKIHEFRFNGKTVRTENVTYHEKFDRIFKWINAGKNVYLYGPAGTGKSHIARQLADILFEGRFHFNNAIQTVFDIIGFEDGNGNYHETEFFRAWRDGGIYLLDEMDASVSEALIALNSALAQGEYVFPHIGRVKKHKDFRCIAGGNTNANGADEQYNARTQIDASTMDRFKFIQIGYSPAIEESLTDDSALLEFIREVRHTADHNEIKLLVTYRAIEDINIFKDDENEELQETLREALVKGLAIDDLQMLVRNMTINRGNKYFQALRAIA